MISPPSRLALSMAITLALVVIVSCGSAVRKEGYVDGVYVGRAEGKGLIFRNDVKRARENAISQALEMLVDKAKAETPPGAGPSAAEAFVLGSNARIVKNARVLSEGVKGSHFVVIVEGEVHTAGAYDEVRKLIKKHRIPRVMIFINEQVEGVRSRPGITLTELAIAGTLASLGFEVLDPGAVKGLAAESIPDDFRGSPGSNGRLGAELRRLGAGLIIVGIARTADQSKVMSQLNRAMRSKRAIMGLKAIDLATGAIMASVSLNAPGVGRDDAAATRSAVEHCVARALGRFDLREERFRPGTFLQQIILNYARRSERMTTSR